MPTNNQFVIPEILAAIVEEKLGESIKLYPLAKKENIQAKAGNVITIPTMEYIGMAEDVAAGANIPLSNFAQGQSQVEVKKAGKGMTFTEEDLVNHYIDVQGEAEKQITKAIADYVEKEMFDALATATLTANVATLDCDGLGDALVPFGEEIEDAMVLFVHPKNLAVLRKDDNFVINANHGGDVKSAGYIFGMEVVISNRVPEDKAFIVKQDAVALYMKKGVEVETDKNILNQTYQVVATMHYAVALNDATKVVAVTIGEAGQEPSV